MPILSSLVPQIVKVVYAICALISLQNNLMSRHTNDTCHIHVLAIDESPESDPTLSPHTHSQLSEMDVRYLLSPLFQSLLTVPRSYPISTLFRATFALAPS